MKQTALTEQAEHHAHVATIAMRTAMETSSVQQRPIISAAEAIVHAVLALACQVADGHGVPNQKRDCCGKVWSFGQRCDRCGRNPHVDPLTCTTCGEPTEGECTDCARWDRDAGGRR
jgi:hypothetical protein